ncbi:MAG: CubicO group peptidase (beta-lactamase class C family) [Halieaceae bacterium]|jgi:CubicO group peptidase (beta-lactamase class C family)
MKLQHYLIYFFLLWHASASAFAQTGNVQGVSLTRLDRIDSMAQQYIDAGRLPPVVYAVARRGETVRVATVGSAKKDDIFRIYSMTKPVTTVAVLQLYEAGKFLLTDPVSRYLPEFTSPHIYLGTDNDGVVQTRPAVKPITIEDLLTHTAGLTYGDPTTTGVSLLYSAADIWSADSLARFSDNVAALPLMFEPGSRWHYSVANDILGRLVEVVAGRPFDRFVQLQILEPLAMTDTSFVLPGDKVSRFTDIYARDGETMIRSEAAASSAYLDPNKVPYGGGGLLSTAADYLRFAQMLLNGGELDGNRILGRKTVDLMMMDHLAGFEEPKLGDDWVGRTENRSKEMHLGLGYGYGGYVITDVAVNDVPGSVGTYSWGGTASTYFFVDREEQLIGLFLTQLTPSDSYPLRAQFRGLVYQALVD